MDVNTLRIIITVTSMAVFLGIIWWAYSAKQRERFKEAENLPFADGELHDHTVNAQRPSDTTEHRREGNG